MCLDVDPKITAKLLAGPSTIRAWKVLVIGEDGLRGVWYAPYGWWKPGINRSNSRAKKVRQRGIVDRGIHVYLNRAAAVLDAGEPSDFQRVVPVTCHIEDLIAGGDGGSDDREAVFTKVHLSQQAYDKAMKP